MQREKHNSDENSERENVYLCKILLFTKDARKIAEQLKPLSENSVSTNCLDTIGMYPLVEHVQTPLGTLSMSIWIINTEEQFAQFRMGYYSGASQSIILCNNQEELDNFEQLYLMSPTGVPTTILSKTVNDNETPIDQENFLLTSEAVLENQGRVINYRNIPDIQSIRSIFRDIGNKISDDIASGEYHTFTPELVTPSNIYRFYNKKSFDKVQQLVGNLGYELNERGIVTITKTEFSFEVDFYRNQVTAFISKCLLCENKCKHYRKLCVIEEDQGYSNKIHFDNLRALAILYSIHDGDFEKLHGGTEKENIDFQLQRLRKHFQGNCNFEQEERKFQKQLLKVSKKRKKQSN